MTFLDNYIVTDYGTDSNNSDVVYVLRVTELGAWLISKIDNTSVKFASSKNNPSYSTKNLAWANRESLTYSDLENII